VDDSKLNQRTRDLVDDLSRTTRPAIDAVIAGADALEELKNDIERVRSDVAADLDVLDDLLATLEEKR
jgi:hypothetical protein